MSNAIHYVSTALIGANKCGKLKRDNEGYYEIVLGGLNVINSTGAVYTMEGSRALLDKSNLLNRRLQAKRLNSELGHPKRQPGWTDDEYFARILSIEETNICSHIREFRLEPRSGTDEVMIIGWVKPSGPHRDHMEESFNNPNENVCYSIRSFTDDYRQGYTRKKVLKTVVTWDKVNDPGISFANKLDTPSLEDMTSCIFTRSQLERVVEQANDGGPSLESMMLSAQDLLAALGQSPIKSSAFMRW